MKILQIGEVNQSNYKGKSSFSAWGKVEGINDNVLIEAAASDMLVAGKGYTDIKKVVLNKKAGGTFTKIIINPEKTKVNSFIKNKYTLNEFEKVFNRAMNISTKNSDNDIKWVAIFERYINNALIYGVKIPDTVEAVKQAVDGEVIEVAPLPETPPDDSDPYFGE